MFHSADLLGTPFSLTGAAHAYLPDFTPDAFLNAVQKSRATFTMLSPTLLIRIIREGRFGDFDISSLRRLTYGSAPMDTVWVRRTMEAFPGVELRIVDEEGNDLPAGEAGEVAVRARNVSPGYLDRPDETAAVFRGGWFFTGDVGRLDGEGFLYLLDRKRDMIITGGENVWSGEVEAALYRHPDVMEAAVIGVPEETWGEAILAVIVPEPGSDLADGGEDALIEHCRRFIGGYKVPRRFRFVDALPKSAMGKPLKAELRRRYRNE